MGTPQTFTFNPARQYQKKKQWVIQNLFTVEIQSRVAEK
jgi:hypothetical protein